MRQCPKCEVGLFPASYEGFRVYQCVACKGYLVPLRRLKSIQRLPRRSHEELKAEAQAEFAGSGEAAYECPRCHREMEREAEGVSGVRIYVDRCPSCRLVWLDGGELAMLQLAFETTQEFRSADHLRQRMRALEASPERKAQFEEDLANLPEAKEPVSEAFGRGFLGLLGALFGGRRRW